MPDRMDKIRQWAIPAEVLQLIEQLEAAGEQAFLIGGAVRDLWLGVEPSDYDLATSADPQTIREIFGAHDQVLAGLKHGTVGVIVGHKVYEITSFREDRHYADHRRPQEVMFTSSLAKDVQRRDFTMNALAYSPSAGLVDLAGGIEDLQQGLIRCVGNPFTRFSEDALRIMRAYRLAADYGFLIETESLRAARHLLPDLCYVAAERISAELRRLLVGDYFTEQLALHRDVLHFLFPELDEGTWQRLSAEAFAALPPDFVLRLSLIGAVLPREVPAEVGMRLRLSRPENKAFLSLSLSAPLTPPPDPVNLLRFARDYEVELADWRLLLAALALGPAGPSSEYLQAVDRSLLTIETQELPTGPLELAISGRDLREAGWKQSPAIGQALERLWLDCLEGRVANDYAALSTMAEVYRH